MQWSSYPARIAGAAVRDHVMPAEESPAGKNKRDAGIDVPAAGVREVNNVTSC